MNFQFAPSVRNFLRSVMGRMFHTRIIKQLNKYLLAIVSKFSLYTAFLDFYCRRIKFRSMSMIACRMCLIFQQ